MRRLFLGLTLIVCGGVALAQQHAAAPQRVATAASKKPVAKPAGSSQTAATPAPEKPASTATKPTAKKPPPKSPIARDLFGAVSEPAPLPTQSVGGYAKGCLAGGVALPVTGPDWQVMRLSRNRNWGNTRLVDYVERLASDAHALDGWPGLLIGDMSQPRGGPMLNGHASHQIGLDVDIWLTPMPDHVLTPQEREDMSAASMLKDPFTVDPQIFTLAQVKLLRRAASYPQVGRIFVHPAIKKALCEQAAKVGKDTAWLGKVRPWWNHHYHFHVRLTCPPGEDTCENQKPITGDNGCGQELTNWYAMLKKAAIAAAKAPAPSGKPGLAPSGKPPLRMAELPKECGAVLTSGGFQPPVPSDTGTSDRPPAALAALETKDAGPPIPLLTPAQLKALTGDSGGMLLPDRNPMR